MWSVLFARSGSSISSSPLWLAFVLFFFKQKTAYEMRISDWSSDVCSSDLMEAFVKPGGGGPPLADRLPRPEPAQRPARQRAGRDDMARHAIEQPRKFQPPLVGDKRDMMPPRAQNLAQHIGGHHMAAGADGRQHDRKRDRVHSFHPPA